MIDGSSRKEAPWYTNVDKLKEPGMEVCAAKEIYPINLIFANSAQNVTENLYTIEALLFQRFT